MTRRSDFAPSLFQRAAGAIGGVVGGLLFGVIALTNLENLSDEPSSVEIVLTVLFLGIMCACLAIAYRAIFAKSKASEADRQISRSELTQLAQQLHDDLTHQPDGSFAVVMFSVQQQTSGDAYNIQFSVEDAKIGIDWVLNSPLNQQDSKRFEAFAEEREFPLALKEANGVRYFRHDGERSLELMQLVLTELYDVTAAEHFVEHAHK